MIINAGHISIATLPNYYDPNPIDSVRLTLRLEGFNTSSVINYTGT